MPCPPPPPPRLGKVAVVVPICRLFPSCAASAAIFAAAVVVHRPFVLLLLAAAVCCPPFCGAQEVPEFMLSRKDIVDKNVEASETVLSPADFANIPEKEVDLRRLGIRVELDPTMGNKVEGDIVGWAAPAPPPPPPSKDGTTSAKGQQMVPRMMAPKRNTKAGAADPFGKEHPQQNSGTGTVVLFDENGLARNSIRQPYRRWPHNEIPYAVSAQYGSYSRSVIAKAISEYHSKTCVRFVPRDARKHSDYVWIHPDDGCYSLVGRTGGRQPLSLDSGCIQVGTIVHELMHAVGFFHEQSRYDRDGFIQILWSNVLRGADDQFEKYSYNTIDQLGEPYDYGSIMHYGPYAFSSNGKRTIVPRRAGANRMGQRVSFSETDLRKINKLYQCENRQTKNTNNNNNNRANANSRNWGHQQQVISGGDGRTSPPPPDADDRDDDDDSCEDGNWRCMFWSMPILHYCARSEVIRRDICPLSCGTCTPRAAPVTSSSADQKSKSAEEGKKGEEEGEEEARIARRTTTDHHNNNNNQCADRSQMCRHINRAALCTAPLGKMLCQKRCNRC